MRSFRTEIKIQENTDKIEYDTKVMFLGSCFATHIGQKFNQVHIPNIVNPYGVIYNPISVANTLSSIIENKQYAEDELHFKDEQWHSFYHHSSFSNKNKEECLKTINTNNNESHHHLKHAEFVFITFGTAWVYQWIKTNQIVSNCHKHPANLFNRYILNIDEIVNTYKKLLTNLLVFNPNIKVIFTVSPVRHWKDGAHGNQISKASLLLAIENIIDLFESCQYFPAYELLMDDLRDYRFYNDDMLHPNTLAIEYIWEKFEMCFFSKNTLDYKKEMIKLDKAISHRPFDTSSSMHQEFLKNQIEKIKHLNSYYPNTNFSQELNYFKSKII